MLKGKPVLVGEKKRPNALYRDAIDQLMFDSISHARKIGDLCTDDPSTALVEDSFTSFFSRQPKMAEKAPRLQRELLETMMALPEYKDLHAGTHDDEISAALGATNFAPRLIEQYRELEQKKKEKQKKDGDQEQGEGKDGEDAGEGPGIADLMNDQDMASLRQGMREALSEAQEKTDQWDDAVRGWGLDKGELRELPAEKRMELAETLLRSDKLARISELAGRFKNIVNAKAATVPVHGYDEIVDINISDDVARMLPTELVKMIETPDLFLADYCDKKLLTYNLKGIEDAGKGPIIVAMDISGSMSGPREEWSKAVVLALMRLAEKQKRAFGFMAFESEVHNIKYFPKGHAISIEDKMAIASISTMGGTEFHRPLMEAFRLRAKEPSLKPADIIFVTDGDCYMTADQTAEVNALRKSTEVRIYSIAIDGNGESLKSFSDQVSQVKMNGDITVDVVKDLVSHTASGSRKAKAK